MYSGQNDMLHCAHHPADARQHGFGQVFSGPVSTGTTSSANCEVLQPVDCSILSPLQVRILEGVAAGFSSGQLSRELYFSAKTIDYHVRVMSDKLQAPNRVALVSRAFVLEILQTDSWPPRVAREP
jgi:DNA-binding NarL/FixJ family response regulator